MLIVEQKCRYETFTAPNHARGASPEIPGARRVRMTGRRCNFGWRKREVIGGKCRRLDHVGKGGEWEKGRIKKKNKKENKDD